MKNIAAKCIFLSFMLLILGACGGGQNATGDNPPSTNAEPTTSSAPASGAIPTITGFSPAWQSVGSAITLSGTDFAPNTTDNTVKFANDKTAIVASATSTALVVIVPSGAIVGPITVTTTGGTAATATSFVVQSTGGITAPTITGFPLNGTIGTTLTINGTNFVDAAPENNLVTFNGTPATVLQATATMLEVLVPNATSGNITVTTPTGTAISASTFNFLPLEGSLPLIKSFTPLRGDVGGVVTIYGSNFDPIKENNIVKFHGVPAEVTSATTSSLTVTVPNGATSGPITVTTAGKTTKSALNFTLYTGVIPVNHLMGGSIQGSSLNLLGTTLAFAGGGIVKSAMDGTGTSARFSNPNGMTIDGTVLYIADSGNRIIRRLDLLTGTVTTLAGSGVAGSDDGVGPGASFSTPNGITTDGTSLFVTDSGNNRIRKITPLTGTLSTMTPDNAKVTTFAGSGTVGFKDATGIYASFTGPRGITTDGINLYVADGSNRIRQIAIGSAEVTTLAGSGAWSSIDGTGTMLNPDTIASTGATYPKEVVASFYRPRGIAISLDKNTLYVTDSGTNAIRAVTIATGVVTTVVQGVTGVPGETAKFQNPDGISTDGTNLYVADSNNNTIRQVELSSGSVTILAGTGRTAGDKDDTGSLASFRLPTGLVLVGSDLYVADSGNNLIRKIDIPSKVVLTVAGNVVAPADINGIGTSSKFNFPYGITTDGSNLYVADSGDQLIRKIVIDTGKVSILAGTGRFGSVDARGASASFNYPFGVTTDGTNLYVADTGNNTIRQIVIATGDVTTLAGSGAFGSTNGVGVTATFSQPIGITTDGINLYVADTGSHKIRRIVIDTGEVTTLAGSGVIGSMDAAGTAASFNNPTGITMDENNNLYIADNGSNKIRQIEIATGVVATLAGTGDYWYNDFNDKVNSSWLGSEAHFRHPTGITSDGRNLYVADADNNQIRKIDLSSGFVSNLSGSGAFGATDGTGTEASFGQPVGITTDGKHLYTTEYLNNLIRKIQ